MSQIIINGGFQMYNKTCGHHFSCHCPPQIFPNQYDPPKISPTQQTVNTNVFKTVVPHIHPSHTTTVNKHLFNHQHYFPQSESVVNECYEEHLMCGMPYNPCCHPRPFGC